MRNMQKFVIDEGPLYKVSENSMLPCSLMTFKQNPMNIEGIDDRMRNEYQYDSSYVHEDDRRYILNPNTGEV